MASDDAGMLGHRETGAPREPLCVRIERLSTGRAALAWIFVACSCAGGAHARPELISVACFAGSNVVEGDLNV
jgi:hypothetical protein